MWQMETYIDETHSRASLDNMWQMETYINVAHGCLSTRSRCCQGNVPSPRLAFPSVEISLTDENCLKIHAPLVNPEELATNDIAELNPDNLRQFCILGRKDNIICSGGIKLQIEQIEEALRPLINVPFAIAKSPDPQLAKCLY